MSEKMQVALNKKEKEELVIKLYHENKTIRQIAEIVHMSFNDIGSIIRRVNGQDNDKRIDTKLSNKSKATQALYLFEHDKKPIEIAIELDISYNEVIDLQLEFWALKELYDLPLVYHELKHDFDSFLKLFKILKKNKILNERNIYRILRYTGHDLPALENKIRKLTSDVIELEFQKRDLKNTIMLQRAQLSDLGQAITEYQKL
jgi:transposase